MRLRSIAFLARHPKKLAERLVQRTGLVGLNERRLDPKPSALSQRGFHEKNACSRARGCMHGPESLWLEAVRAKRAEQRRGFNGGIHETGTSPAAEHLGGDTNKAVKLAYLCACDVSARKSPSRGGNKWRVTHDEIRRFARARCDSQYICALDVSACVPPIVGEVFPCKRGKDFIDLEERHAIGCVEVQKRKRHRTNARAQIKRVACATRSARRGACAFRKKPGCEGCEQDGVHVDPVANASSRLRERKRAPKQAVGCRARLFMERRSRCGGERHRAMRSLAFLALDGWKVNADDEHGSKEDDRASR